MVVVEQILILREDFLVVVLEDMETLLPMVLITREMRVYGILAAVVVLVVKVQVLWMVVQEDQVWFLLHTMHNY
jgi:hypothetical protein